jgi:hypothetical protein
MSTSDTAGGNVPERVYGCCQNCGEYRSSMNRCGKCKVASYCSRECQVSHWKLHKERCRQTQETYKNAKADDRKREFRLFREWTDQSLESIVFFTGRSFCENEWLESTEDGKVIVLRVAFDYNKLTFKPFQPLAVISTADPSLEGIRGKLENYQQGVEEDGSVFSVAFVIFKDYVLPVPFTRPNAAARNSVTHRGDPWYDLRLTFDSIKLTSSIFGRWDTSLQQKNIELQLEVMKTHKDFVPFLFNALRVKSKKPLYRDHVVVVEASLGLGLGEIFSLDSFEVNTTQLIASRFLEAGLGQESLEDFVTKKWCSTDSVHADLVYIPVVFLFSKPAHFIMANKIPSTLAKKQVPVHKCDRLANENFKELQRVPMPPVSSPDLNE